MESLMELRAAFAKVIVSYRNKKVAANLIYLDIDSFVKASDSVAAVKACLEETIKIESSKETHLALFYDVFFMLDDLCKNYKPQDDYSRLSLMNELILIIQTLYLLNHDGYSHDFSFSGKRDNLDTTVKFSGYGPGITELGDSIREYILIPLGGSGHSVQSASSKDSANKNITANLLAFFEGFKKYEEDESEKERLKKQVEEQKKRLLHLQELLPTEKNDKLVSSTYSLSTVGFFESPSTSQDCQEDVGAEIDGIDATDEKKNSNGAGFLSFLWS